MSLQLYQVDQKSFLLDFKSLNSVEVNESNTSSEASQASMPQSLPSTPASFSDLGKVKKCDPYVCTVVITINAIYSINIVYTKKCDFTILLYFC
jgi:hypothetical protein